MTDEQFAKFATTAWVTNVAAVPLEECATMVAEDPSVITTLVAALRHARERAENAENALKGPEVHWNCQQKIDALEAQLTEACSKLAASTKHGPRQGGGSGPCDHDCWKCWAEKVGS